MNEPNSPVVSPPELPQPAPPACANCGTRLEGEYCASCGQRHEPHVHSIAHFAGEALESISHADSRLWRTLLYLLVRPGFLTRQFFEGKRVGYLPPFRLYLVISVIFFLVANLPDNLRAGTKVNFDVDGKPTAESVESLDEAARAIDRMPASAGRDAAAAAIRAKAAQQKAALDSGATGESKREGLQDKNAFTDFCDAFKAPDPKAGKNYENFRRMCAQTKEDHGEALVKEIVHNLPRAMFVFLPLLALFMKLLYWRPKRYYVEHLLLLIHNHAFVFLALAILGALKRIPVVGGHLGWLEGAVWIYIVYYIFRAMRVYYQQSRWLTFGKYLTVGCAYLFAGLTVLVGTAIFTALTL